MIGLGLAPAGRSAGAAFDFSGGAMPAGASLTRASAGTRFNAAGVLASEAADVARFDFDPVTRACRGLLVEPAATNLLADASAFDGAAWARSAALAVTANAEIAPDGTATADVLTDGSTSSHASATQGVAAGALVASLFVRKDMAPRTTRTPLLRLSGPQIDLTFDTQTGDSLGAGGAIDCGDWWRVWVATAGGSTLAIYPAVATGALGTAYAMATTGAITAWGAQVETGDRPTSFVTGTRAADLLVLDWASRGVADGAVTLRYGFDDGSTQEVAATVSGGVTAVPTTLARRRIRRVERV